MKFNKKISSSICLSLAVLTFLYYLFLSFLPGGHNFGITLVGLHSLAFGFFGVVLRKSELLPPKLLKTFQVLGGAFVCWLFSILIMAIFLLSGAKNNPLADPDYLLILGAGLIGSQPSLTLQERLDTALLYLTDKPDLKIIVSGGQGPNEALSEAEAMRTYLVQKGIKKSRILLETKSRNTKENFLFTSELLKAETQSRNLRINVVTNDFHIRRSLMLASKYNFIAGSIPAPTPWYLLPADLLREYAAYVKAKLLT